MHKISATEHAQALDETHLAGQLLSFFVDNPLDRLGTLCYTVHRVSSSFMNLHMIFSMIESGAPGCHPLNLMCMGHDKSAPTAYPFRFHCCSHVGEWYVRYP